MQICEIFKMNQSVQLLNLGHGIFQKVIEKVMEIHGIFTAQKCLNSTIGSK